MVGACRCPSRRGRAVRRRVTVCQRTGCATGLCDSTRVVQESGGSGQCKGAAQPRGAYDNEHGVPQDYLKAREWYEKAAAQGDAAAQSMLGFLYASGKGVLQDYTKAREWWDKAAAQGEVRAQSMLAFVYAEEKGVPKDHTKAREWSEKAAAQGDHNAKQILKSL